MNTPGATDYPALVDLVSSSFKLATDATTALINTFNNGIRNINGNPLIRPFLDLTDLRELLDKLRGYVEKFAKFMQDFQQHHMPIIALIRNGFDWLTAVQAPVSNVAGKVATPADKYLRSWEGATGAAYLTDVLGGQSKALGNLHPKADAISKWLIDLARVNTTFLTQYADKIGELGGTLVAAIVDAGTIVGALEAAGKAGEFAGQLVENAVKVFTETVNYYMTAAASMRDALSVVSNTDGFPDRTWPQAVK
ncbi:hypothetical protein JOF53_003612 [Crossiella equi]|uniref:Uncharacterized protein n=1 Tax=Crossiella equi TaxID=130796 RepID=A0ABS5ADS1_9PSEU|nr:hypothetical protein [Crossiella equi]MBP2474740.1 hypothetical protein [Crossiella equi]